MMSFNDIPCSSVLLSLTTRKKSTFYNARSHLIAAFFPDSIDAPAQDEVKSLGHVRLAIIDLPTGQQPLSDDEELINCHCRYWGSLRPRAHPRRIARAGRTTVGALEDFFPGLPDLIFSRYKRDGFNFLPHLRGEFAFVLYDVKRRHLFAGRDLESSRSTTLSTTDASWFGSEMKAFASLGWDIESIVHNGEFGDERTVFKFRGVQKMPACRLLRRRRHGASDDIQTQAYWDQDPTTDESPLAKRTAVHIGADLRKVDATEAPTTFSRAVRDAGYKCSRQVVLSGEGADEPFGSYSCFAFDYLQSADPAQPSASRSRLRPNGASWRKMRPEYPSRRTAYWDQDPTTDESPLAKRTAVHIAADLRKIDATEARLVGFLEESIWHSEQPATTFSRAVRDAGYKVVDSHYLRARSYSVLMRQVVLSGEGADELFGGYSCFAFDYLQSAEPTRHSPRHPAQCHISNAPRPPLVNGLHPTVLSLSISGSGSVFRPQVVECAKRSSVREHSMTVSGTR
ncbi:hypothetical protein GGX14DRAFT_581738 [Mycena pura]|uniref:Glutamine amidotransferase type-2 domain-containing protein n=1 Tax=Mycena pura TaxID=153505 RepID=A0AAD7E5H2_9AGAR|nr:hypothetical protein GGX14DRAFT_581738 [Mycena pura]